jgi:hypothetical protein
MEDRQRSRDDAVQERRRSLEPIGPTNKRKYIDTLISTFLCTSYLSYQYNLVTLNTFEHITRRDLHHVQDYAPNPLPT